MTPAADPLASPCVPVAWGEAVDKHTILAIKHARIADPAARANIAREIAAIDPVVAPALARLGMVALIAELTAINEALWDIEDAIRARDAAGEFGAEFVALARAVYRTNDRRAAVKRAINDLLGSTLVEEKSYASFNDSSVEPQSPTTSRVIEAGSTANR